MHRGKTETRTFARARAYTHAHRLVCPHICTNTHSHTHSHTHTHTHTRTQTHANTHTNKQTHTHTHTRTHIHTHTHTHTYTCFSFFLSLPFSLTRTILKYTHTHAHTHTILQHERTFLFLSLYLSNTEHAHTLTTASSLTIFLFHTEHCLSHDSNTMFYPPNNKEIWTCPATEYDYVCNYDPTKNYPGASCRKNNGTVQFFLKLPKAKEAGLTESEVQGLRLYSGPMFICYNLVLRKQTVKKYVTTIHAIVSGIIKLASVWKIPIGRVVFRGLSGILLPEQFWDEDAYGAKGGVEFGIMSTTTSMAVAVQYSSHGQVPTVFQIEIGQVDRGAELSWISVRHPIQRHFPNMSSCLFQQLCQSIARSVYVAGRSNLTPFYNSNSLARRRWSCHLCQISKSRVSPTSGV